MANSESVVYDCQYKLSCSLCRGDVSRWIIVDIARVHLDEKKHSCDEQPCAFIESYSKLQKHAQMEHHHACPSKIDPARHLE